MLDYSKLPKWAQSPTKLGLKMANDLELLVWGKWSVREQSDGRFYIGRYQDPFLCGRIIRHHEEELFIDYESARAKVDKLNGL